MGQLINLTVEDDTNVALSVDNEDSIDVSADGVVEVSTNDYNKLINKPSINSTTLVGNYDEIDPTVPAWAKDTEPQEITQTHVEFIWASIFG